MEYRRILPDELQRLLPGRRCLGRRGDEEEVNSVNGEKPVFSGLFICHDWQNKANIKDPEGHGLIPSEIEEAVRGSMESGAAGVALFTPGNMTDEHWKAFDKAIHQTYTVKK